MGLTTGRTDLCFVKEETTPGTMVVPAGGDVLLMIADAQIDQSKSTFPSLERRDSYSYTELLSGRYPAGTFQLEFYMRRTGTNNTGVTAIKTLMKNLFGREDTSSGTDIVYRLARTIDTDLNFTLFYRKGGIFFQCAGCFINEATWQFVATPEEAAILRCVASGFFWRKYWVGTTVTTEDASTTDAGLLKVKIATAKCDEFVEGSYIKVGTDTGAHKITDIDTATGIITFTTALGANQTSGATVTGYMPTATESGAPLSAHKGLMTYDSNNYLPIGGAIKMNNGRRVIVEQKNDNDYPDADAREDMRNVTFEDIRAYANPVGDVRHTLLFAHADQLTQKSIQVTFGNETGKKWLFSMPQSIIQNPRLSGDGIVEFSAMSRALASAAYDDELTLKSF